MQRKKTKKIFQLGDLIAALFEASRDVTPDPAEQRMLVYAALMDLLGERKRRPALA